MKILLIPNEINSQCCMKAIYTLLIKTTYKVFSQLPRSNAIFLTDLFIFWKYKYIVQDIIDTQTFMTIKMWEYKEINDNNMKLCHNILYLLSI